MANHAKSRKSAGELMSLYFEMKDFINEQGEHPNFDLAQAYLRAAMVWAKEGIGIINKIGEVIDNPSEN